MKEAPARAIPTDMPIVNVFEALAVEQTRAAGIDENEDAFQEFHPIKRSSTHSRGKKGKKSSKESSKPMNMSPQLNHMSTSIISAEDKEYDLEECSSDIDIDIDIMIYYFFLR